MRRFGKSFSAGRSHAEMTNGQSDVVDAKPRQDVTSARPKNERRGKVTADKWNQ